MTLPRPPVLLSVPASWHTRSALEVAPGSKLMPDGKFKSRTNLVGSVMLAYDQHSWVQETFRTVKVPVGEMVSRGAERKKIPFRTRKHPGRVTKGSVVENVPCLLLCRKQYGKRGSGPWSGGADNSV